MAIIKNLPTIQNWDCQATGSCCKEYVVTLSDDERQRIEKQGWTSDDLGHLSGIKTAGPPWRRKYQLNHRPDGSCVFLSEQGRCRIHEKFGYEAKPLPCRLFPFVLVPVADHWRVGLRYACPSAAANKGRAIPEHESDLLQFADSLAARENLKTQLDGSLVPPPKLEFGQKLDWPDILRVVDTLLAMLKNRREPLERRMRKCVAMMGILRKANLEGTTGSKLGETLELLRNAVDAETPANLMMLPEPGWVGRILFRQALALFMRKDHGPNRGIAAQGRIALLRAALQFTRGAGAVPRLHRLLPDTTFEEVERPRGPIPLEAEYILERYYTIKVSSLQFCGPASFGLPLWEGFEALAVTFPVIHWVARMFRDVPREQAITTALTVVDDHIGFNRVLASFRQRLSFHILTRGGELSRLIAWYSR
jgi:lysine-N-methylase